MITLEKIFEELYCGTNKFLKREFG